MDAACAHLDDLRAAVARVRDDARLGSRERDCVDAEIDQGHRRQCARDALSDRDEHVELPFLGVLGHLARHREQPVGRVTHRGEHAHHTVTCLVCNGEPSRDGEDALRIGDRRAAELHHDDVGRIPLRIRPDRRNRLELGRGHAERV